MNKTFLYPRHKSLGARFGEFAGFSMPLQYEGVAQEVRAVRESCGVFDVSHMGEFLVTGPEASSFVDYLLTNDVGCLPPGKALYSPLCNHEGRILDDLIAYKFSSQEIFLCVNASRRGVDLQWINSQAPSFKVKVEDLTENYSLLAFQGPQAFSLIKRMLPSLPQDLTSFGVCRLREGEIVARTGYTGEDGVEIFSSHDQIDALWGQLMDEKVPPVGLVARDVLRIEACYPLYGQDLLPELTPFDVGLAPFVKLEKGSFIGRKALRECFSSPKKKLVKLSLQGGIPRPGYFIINDQGQEIGAVTSGTYSPYLERGLALGLIDGREVLNQDFFIKVRNRTIPCERAKKSFLKLKGERKNEQ